MANQGKKEPKKGSKGTKKYGRNEEKCKRYAAAHKREKHKIKKILRSNGSKAAEEYSIEAGLYGWYKGLL
jgi:hypothetical protein